VTSDNHDPDAIKGDVIPGSIRRVSGKRGSDDGLIEIPLVGHAHRYRVRVELSSGAPRLVELHLIGDDAEIDPATIRQVPVRRLAKAAARFISLTEHGVAVAGDFDDPTDLLRPDYVRPSRRPGRATKLDDVHYRQVANLLRAAREIGLPPREYVADRLGGATPTIDRWIAEAKRRRFLPRDWATALPSDWATTTEENQP
jgi:hypothetical protein